MGLARTQQACTMIFFSSFLFFFLHTHLLYSFWTSRGYRCRAFSPPVLALNFYFAEGSAIPLLVYFSSSVANSPSRAFRKSICVQEKVPRIYTSMHSGGFELTKLTHTRLEDNLIRHRGYRLTRYLVPGERLLMPRACRATRLVFAAVFRALSLYAVLGKTRWIRPDRGVVARKGLWVGWASY